MGLNDVAIPEEKEKLVAQAKEEVDAVWNNYLMGLNFPILWRIEFDMTRRPRTCFG